MIFHGQMGPCNFVTDIANMNKLRDNSVILDDLYK